MTFPRSVPPLEPIHLENPALFCYTCLRSCPVHGTGDARQTCMEVHLCLGFSLTPPLRANQPHPERQQQDLLLP
jgi:hypothetical protein